MITKLPQTELALKIQTKDASSIFSIKRKIAARLKKSQPVDKMLATVESLTIKSLQKSKDIATTIPSLEFDPSLPIVERYDEIIDLIKNNQVIILAGETGCGKTTQLPKMCLMAGLGVAGKIAHTQPRRVAATSVASRIASEVKSPLGELVGYSVRFSDKTSENTRIKLMTDGVLLAELQSDPLLSQYEVIIIDEAHERSLNIDFLLGFLKKILEKRKDLKVIVTSATIDPESFSKYFNNAPTLLVEGRTYPVEVKYQDLLELDGNDSVDPILLGIQQAVDNCVAHSSGDILIFSHGEGEIKQIDQFLQKHFHSNLQIMPLYARLGIKEQQNIFKPSNKRKIIIATNVAETSLTIPNIVFVIDIGTARISRYSQRNKIQQLPVEKISQASAEQRKGRCGRVAPGICIRLYSEEDFNAREAFTLAEIRRTNLSSVVLRLKAMKVEKVESFPFIQPPEDRQWKVAFNLLFELAAMTENREITSIGREMSKLPLDPQLARLLLNKNIMAVDEILIIASFLTVRDIRQRPHDKAQKADQLHSVYLDKASDLMTVIKLWRCVELQKKELTNNAFRRWCQKNMLNFIGWLEWRNVYFQIKESALQLGLTINSQPASHEIVHREMVSGFISHIMIKTLEHHYQGARAIKVWLHPSSQFFKAGSSWLLSTEMMETDKLYARGNVPIKPEWINEIAPHLVKSHFQDIHWRKNKGCASAFLNQTLLGLPILNRVLIDYSCEDPVISRQIFLRDGLAEKAVNQSFPFLDKNQNTLDTIKSEEEKLRAMDICISEDELANLYGERIPEHIVNINGLKKWLKKDWKNRNELLVFSKTLLSQKETDTVEEFPSQIMVRGVSLELSYSFSPGEKYDGVSVNIPVDMVNQFKQSDFDWLVPGYLQEKILFVIKLLPKPIRKQLFPLSETAEKCSEIILKQDYQQQPFKHLLSQVLQKVAALDISLDDLDLNGLPVHLKMKFKTTDQAGKKLLHCTELLQLATQVKSKSTQTVKIQPLSTHKKLLCWPEFDIEIESNNIKQGQNVRLFSGLFDGDSFVELRHFSSREEAELYHQKGVARLLVINQTRLVKSIKNSWPDRQLLERLNLRFGGFELLLDWCVMATAFQFVQQAKHNILCAADFKALNQAFATDARQKISEQLIVVEKLLKQLDNIYSNLASLTSEVYADSISDIKDQIESLWCLAHFMRQGDSLSQNFKRYFLAIESRIARLEGNFPKEQQALENWIEWQDWWQEISQINTDFSTEAVLDKLFWLLQEYRVSLFSINVKTQGSVSAKKLQKLFDKIELMQTQ